MKKRMFLLLSLLILAVLWDKGMFLLLLLSIVAVLCFRRWRPLSRRCSSCNSRVTEATGVCSCVIGGKTEMSTPQKQKESTSFDIAETFVQETERAIQQRTAEAAEKKIHEKAISVATAECGAEDSYMPDSASYKRNDLEISVGSAASLCRVSIRYVDRRPHVEVFASTKNWGIGGQLEIRAYRPGEWEVTLDRLYRQQDEIRAQRDEIRARARMRETEKRTEERRRKFGLDE